jgi:hypothetical protein
VACILLFAIYIQDSKSSKKGSRDALPSLSWLIAGAEQLMSNNSINVAIEASIAAR